MRVSQALVAGICLVAVAGAAGAGELFESTGKSPTRKAPDPGLVITQGLLDCTGAIEIDLGTNPWVYTGTNVGAANNVTSYGCSGWNESGGEVVFHVNFPANVTWTAELSGLTADLDLAVLDRCDESLGCLIVVDNGVRLAAPYPGEIYFVVDGYEGASGSFTLTVETTPYFIPPPICDLIRDVTGTFFTGNTCDGYNNITTSDCGSYPERGREHYYEIQVPAGCTFTASAAFDFEDAAMWLLDSCAAGYACLSYADITYEGEPEVVIYTNESAAPQSLILVVDSYGVNSCGSYQLEFISDCAVATETATFGDVKVLFR